MRLRRSKLIRKGSRRRTVAKSTFKIYREVSRRLTHRVLGHGERVARKKRKIREKISKSRIKIALHIRKNLGAQEKFRNLARACLLSPYLVRMKSSLTNIAAPHLRNFKRQSNTAQSLQNRDKEHRCLKILLLDMLHLIR